MELMLTELTIEDIVRNRNLWVESLENGELEQAFEVLATDDYEFFCCLGVAEEKVGPELPGKYCIKRSDNLGGYIHLNPDYGNDYDDKYIETTGVLHEVLREALGISIEQQTILLCLNDTIRASFENIAKVIKMMNIHYKGEEYDPFGYPI